VTVEDAAPEPFEACAHCGRRLRRGVRYPATAENAPDRELQLYSFCDEECQRAWRDGG